MQDFFQNMFLIGIPSLIIFFRIKINNTKGLKGSFNYTYFAVVFLMIILLSIVRFYSKRHCLSFKLDNKFEISLTADEQQASHEMPLAIGLKIKDVKNNSTKSFSFSTTDGPCLEFFLSKSELKRYQIMVKGCRRNAFRRFLLNIRNGEMTELSSSDIRKLESYKLKAIVNGNFEVEIK